MKVLEYGGVFTAGGLGYGGLELRWRGSRNQRLIDLNATRRTGRLTLLTE